MGCAFWHGSVSVCFFPPILSQNYFSLGVLAELYTAQGKYAEAEQRFQDALRISEQQLGPEHPDVATSLNGLAKLYRHQGKYEQAEAFYERALAIREQSLGTNHPDTAELLHGLAKLLQDQGEHKQAEALYVRALNIQAQRLGAAHPNTQEIRNDYAAFLRSIGRDADDTAVVLSQEQDTNEKVVHSVLPENPETTHHQ